MELYIITHLQMHGLVCKYLWHIFMYYLKISMLYDLKIKTRESSNAWFYELYGPDFNFFLPYPSHDIYSFFIRVNHIRRLHRIYVSFFDYNNTVFCLNWSMPTKIKQPEWMIHNSREPSKCSRSSCLRVSLELFRSHSKALRGPSSGRPLSRQPWPRSGCSWPSRGRKSRLRGHSPSLVS